SQPTTFFFQAADGIRDFHVTGIQTCALPILYAGQRSEGLAPGRVPTAVGRDKPGPTTQHSTAQQCMGTAVWLPPAPLWGRLYAEIGRAACREGVMVKIVSVGVK